MSNLITSSAKELKAALKETEKAANNIMSAAENIQKDIAKIADKKIVEKINKSLLKIFENSNFQDLTGQRMNKVLKNLDEIKNNSSVAGNNFKSTKAKSFEQSLMDGPQLKAANQADIDKLFDSL
jgi:chemotaxis protein CheZ